MKEPSRYGNGNPTYDPLLHNVGGPISRRRTEQVRASLSMQQGIARQVEILRLRIPPDAFDLEAWIADMARARGYADIDDAEQALGLPERRMLARTLPPDADRNAGSDPLRTALLLARTGTGRYFPDGDRLFTRRRLERHLRLTDINTNAFYGMD